jgi:hypothetical protein
MKYVMMIWLCINDPYIPLSSTCVEDIPPQRFDTLEECKIAAEQAYEQVKDPGIYLTTFCSKKLLTSI